MLTFTLHCNCKFKRKLKGMGKVSQRRIVWIVAGDGNGDAASSDGFNNVIVSQSLDSLLYSLPLIWLCRLKISIAVAIIRAGSDLNHRTVCRAMPSAVFIKDIATFITRQDRQTITCCCWLEESNAVHPYKNAKSRYPSRVTHIKMKESSAEVETQECNKNAGISN